MNSCGPETILTLIVIDLMRTWLRVGRVGVCVCVCVYSFGLPVVSLRLMSEEPFSTSRPQALLCTYETLQPSISLHTVRRQSDANVVSEIEWHWEHGKANPNTPTFLFQGQN